MAITIEHDLVRAPGLADGRDGVQVIAHANIVDVTPGTEWLMDLYTEINDAGCGVGSVYSANYPYLICTSIEVLPVGNSTTRATLVRRFVDTRVISVTMQGRVGSSTTRFDYEGNLVKVYYCTGQAADHTPDVSHQSAGHYCQSMPNYADIPKLIPQASLVYERYIDTSVDQSSLERANRILGWINKSTWNGGPAHTWICSEVSGTPLWYHTADETPLIWRERLQFDWVGMALPNNWYNSHDAVLLWRGPNGNVPGGIDPKAGGLTSGATSGNGWKLVQIYGDIEFADLEPQLPEVY